MDRTGANLEAAAPSRPLSLNGRVLLIGQATFADMASIGTVARKHARKDTPLGRIVSDPVFKALPAEHQRALLVEAGRVQAAGGEVVDPFALQEVLLDPGVLSFAVWVLALKHHPDLKLEEVRPHVTGDNAAEVYYLLSEASGMLGLAEKNSAGTSGFPASSTSAG